MAIWTCITPYIPYYTRRTLNYLHVITHTSHAIRTFTGIVYAHLFCACNVCHFHHTWVVFVRHSIANILKCISFLVEAHKIMRNTSISNILWDIRSPSPGASISHTKSERQPMPRLSYFQNCFPRASVSAAVLIWPKSTRKGTKMVEENGRRLRDFTLAAIFFSVEFGHIRTAAETEVRGKHISKNGSIWAEVGSQIQCRWTLRVMSSWGYIMFRHRKLHGGIDITLLDVWWPHVFFLDRSVPLPILYLLTKNKQILKKVPKI